MIARGYVTGTRGALIEAELPGAALGQNIRFDAEFGNVAGAIHALERSRALVAPHGDVAGIRNGAGVSVDLHVNRLPLGMCALGRAFDASGSALDGGPPLHGRLASIAYHKMCVEGRAPVSVPFWTGVKTIDALLTIGRGARTGIFGSPGIGKSSLLETIVRGAHADAVVVALIGERGREAERWISSLDQRTSIVAATSDRTAAERIRAAEVALAHARSLSSRGLDVLVIFDSLARYAAALREIAVGTGESTGRGGYPPSVFAQLARLVERCGTFRSGSITLVATVLNDGDDRDPVSESVRSLIDGHIQLSPALAHSGRFPAIDVLQSASRTMDSILRRDHLRASGIVRTALALLERAADARGLGIEPTDPETLAAIRAENLLEALLRQGRGPVAPDDALRMLFEIADRLGKPHGYPS